MSFKAKILIVDDERDVLLVLDKRLSENGYQVVAANNGYDAIVLAKSTQPDIMILDVTMPEMDGNQVASIIRNEPETHNLPIIFLTGLLSKDIEETNPHSMGGEIFIAKPFRTRELIEEIEKILAKAPLVHN